MTGCVRLFVVSGCLRAKSTLILYNNYQVLTSFFAQLHLFLIVFDSSDIMAVWDFLNIIHNTSGVSVTLGVLLLGLIYW